MEEKNKKILLVIILCILSIVGVLCGIFYPDKPINNTIGEYQNIIKDEIKNIDSNIVIEDITENEKISSNEKTIEEASLEEEKELENEKVNIEIEGFELQGDISYDGDRAKSWNVELEEYNGLTYYSQIDSRWRNQLYTSVGNTTQTIGSSGCGPTCASMIVSSIKGIITPDVMSELFVKNGYRSADNGTYWSAYRAVADEFNIGYTETSNIQKALELLRNNNYIIVSCGNGLFTTGGHYICIVGIEGDTLKIYDPYNYNGKFETSTRRGKVVVEGNTIFCSIENFKKYSNYKGFFCYQNIEHDNRFRSGRVLVNIPVGIAYKGGEKWLVDDFTNQFWINKSVIFDDSRVYGLADIAYDGGETDLIQIFDTQFWCKEKYMASIPIMPPIKNTVGQKRILRQACVIYQKSNLSGLKFNYRANTTVTILENVSSEIDKIKVNSTGRIGYLKNNLYK